MRNINLLIRRFQLTQFLIELIDILSVRFIWFLKKKISRFGLSNFFFDLFDSIDSIIDRFNLIWSFNSSSGCSL